MRPTARNNNAPAVTTRIDDVERTMHQRKISIYGPRFGSVQRKQMQCYLNAYRFNSVTKQPILALKLRPQIMILVLKSTLTVCTELITAFLVMYRIVEINCVKLLSPYRVPVSK